MKLLNVVLFFSVAVLILMVVRVSFAGTTRSIAICSLDGSEIINLARNDTNGNYYIIDEPITDVDNENSTRRLQASYSSAFDISQAERHLQTPVASVRQCSCSMRRENVERRKYYCEMSRDICEITVTGRHVCWNASVAQFVGNLFPFVFFWFGILTLTLFWTELGRNARAFLFRACCPCCKERHQRSLNQDLEYLMINRPERVMSMVHRYGRRAQQRRRRRAYGNEREENEVARRQERHQEGEEENPSTWPTLLPSLVLKTKIYHEKENDADDEEQICTICLNPIQEGMRVGSLSCSHDFHVDCLKGWLKRKNQCPLCNEPPAEFRRLPDEDSL